MSNSIHSLRENGESKSVVANEQDLIFSIIEMLEQSKLTAGFRVWKERMSALGESIGLLSLEDEGTEFGG